MAILIPVERIQDKIYLIRGHKVMIDRDLAKLYGVATKVLNQAVKRNIKRFPNDFMFQLNRNEYENLRSQFATSSWGGRRYLSYVFTEQGVAMLSSVINSERAIQINIVIMRAFVQFRQVLATHRGFADKFNEMERKIQRHDVEISSIYEAIRKLMALPGKKKRKTGF